MGKPARTPTIAVQTASSEDFGYVSPYFRLHPAAWFLLPLLANHNRSKVQIFCYSGVREADEITRRFTALDVAWRETGRLTDAELAAQIRADEIDILIDTALHMQGSRLFDLRAETAPVQVTWLGYPGTTGLSAIDYRLTDPYLDPPGQSDDVYSERSVRLPRTFWCYTPLFETPDVSSLPAATDDHITFGCFNNFHKATPEAFVPVGQGTWGNPTLPPAHALPARPASRSRTASFRTGGRRPRPNRVHAPVAASRLPAAVHGSISAWIPFPIPATRPASTVFGWAFPSLRSQARPRQAAAASVCSPTSA